MSEVGVIVDAYSTGSKLPAQFLKYGIECVHVQSEAEILPFDVDSFMPDSFSKNLVHGNSIEHTADTIKALKPKFVISGSESGVLLADALSERLGLPTNGTALSRARRDKYLMQSALKNRGLRHISTLSTHNVHDAVDFHEREGANGSVVKPADSAGSDGVTFCYSAAEIRTAFSLLLGRRNAMGAENSDLLVQRKLEGQQYIVNTVSINGRHRVSDVWIDNRREIGAACYVGDFEGVDNAAFSEWAEIVGYGSDVLNALGILNGPAHLEIMLMHDGPTLIEMGARMQGSICDMVVHDALGHSHVTLTAQRYADPTRFDNEIDLNNFQSIVPTIAVMLIAPDHGQIDMKFKVERLYGLETYKTNLGLPKAGDRVRRTIDMDTCPGIVYLQSESRAALFSDYRAIREIETSMYTRD